MDQFPTKKKNSECIELPPKIVSYMRSSRKQPAQAGKITCKKDFKLNHKSSDDHFDIKKFKLDVEKIAISCAKGSKPLKGIYSQEWAEKLGAPKKKKSIPYPKLMELRKEHKQRLILGVGEDSVDTSLMTFKGTDQSKGTRFKQKFIKNTPNGGWWVDKSNPLFIHRGSNGAVKLNNDDFKKMITKRSR